MVRPAGNAAMWLKCRMAAHSFIPAGNEPSGHACMHICRRPVACSGVVDSRGRRDAWLCMVYMIEIVCIKVHQAVHKNFNTVHAEASFLYRMRLFYTISERITRQMRGKSRQFVTVRGAGKTGGKQTSSLLVRLFSVSFPHRANARCFFVWLCRTRR